ncbi:MAG: hypothetical protein JWR38_4626 [Mucilaginibacter sp.]|nr:hypothetical protein [Mucilaginibacter sp.]
MVDRVSGTVIINLYVKFHIKVFYNAHVNKILRLTAFDKITQLGLYLVDVPGTLITVFQNTGKAIPLHFDHIKRLKLKMLLDSTLHKLVLRVARNYLVKAFGTSIVNAKTAQPLAYVMGKHVLRLLALLFFHL